MGAVRHHAEPQPGLERPPWWLSSLLGALAGPLSYLAGARLADVGLPLGQWPTLLLLSAVWAAVMLVVHGFAGMYRLRARQIG